MSRIYDGLLVCFALLVVLIQSAPTRAAAPTPTSSHLWDTLYGNDHFGHWIVDRFGLPAFDYTDDEATDPAARWNTGNGQNTAFWHQIGNDRIVANAYNDGYVQLWDGERQYGYANQFDPGTRHYAGGYGYLSDGSHQWSTLYLDRPPGASVRRTFGIGYAETEERAFGIDTRQTVFAPFGSSSALLSQVVLTNTGTVPRTLRYVEYWDVNPMVVPSKLGGAGAVIRESPRATTYNPGLRTLIALPPTDVTPTPHAVFLSSLTDPVASFDTSVSRFVGKGSRARPIELPRSHLSDTLLPHGGMDITFVMEAHVRLLPGATRTLTYAYGYGDPASIAPLVRSLRKAARAALPDSERAWRSALPTLTVPHDKWLARETAWNYYYLRSSATYEDAWHTSFITQGYTYLYEWGLNIAYRDAVAPILPLAYLDPPLARRALLFAVRAQPRTGDIPYGFNHGTPFSLGGPQSRSDDLDAWLLWTTAEYVLVTRDFAILHQREPYYRSHASGSVLQHLETAYEHQIHGVGFGRHGEVRMLSGDWSDGEGQNGSTESTQTTAQAAWTFPFVAQMARADGDVRFAGQLTAEGARLRHAVANAWTGHWFNRGYKGRVPYGVDTLYLNAQPWAILSGAAAHEQAATVAHAIQTLLSAPSPIGMAAESRSQGYAPRKETPTGTGPTGGVWYALNGPAIWALGAVSPALAYTEYVHNTHATYAHAYPDNWFGVLSGPDSYDSFESSSPGQPFLPFYPIQDDHAHLWQLYDTVKESGIQATGRGFRIDPHWPFRDFTWKSAAIGVSYADLSAHGYVRPVASGRLTLRVRLPADATTPIQLQISGRATRASLRQRFATWQMSTHAGRPATWRLAWRRAPAATSATRVLEIVGVVLAGCLVVVAALAFLRKSFWTAR